eukprot:9514511-Heterocapsa_arctica.AAC.1
MRCSSKSVGKAPKHPLEFHLSGPWFHAVVPEQPRPEHRRLERNIMLLLEIAMIFRSKPAGKRASLSLAISQR